MGTATRRDHEEEVSAVRPLVSSTQEDARTASKDTASPSPSVRKQGHGGPTSVANPTHLPGGGRHMSKREQDIFKLHADPLIKRFRKWVCGKYGNMVRAWYTLDTDGNGCLVAKEFCEALRKLGYPEGIQTIWKRFSAIDGGHSVSFDVFDPVGFTLIAQFRERCEELLRLVRNDYDVEGTIPELFEQMDTDGNGKIWEAEFVAACVQRLGYSSASAAALFQLVDVSGKGIVLCDVLPGLQRDMMGVTKEQQMVTLEMRLEMRKQQQQDLIDRVKRRQSKNIVLKEFNNYYSSCSSSSGGPSTPENLNTTMGAGTLQVGGSSSSTAPQRTTTNGGGVLGDANQQGDANQGDGLFASLLDDGAAESRPALSQPPRAMTKVQEIAAQVVAIPPASGSTTVEVEDGRSLPGGGVIVSSNAATTPKKPGSAPAGTSRRRKRQENPGGPASLHAFRLFLKQKFGSVVLAWMHFDVDNSGRISFREFTRGCREVGWFLNLRQLWNEFDQERTGFITIDFLDTSGDSKLLSKFTNDVIVKLYGNVERAWRLHFVREQLTGRVPKPVFLELCSNVGVDHGSSTPTNSSISKHEDSSVAQAGGLPSSTVEAQRHRAGAHSKTIVEAQSLASDYALKVWNILDFDRSGYMTRDKFILLDLYHEKDEETLRKEAEKLLEQQRGKGGKKDGSGAQKMTLAEELLRRRMEQAQKLKREVLDLYENFKSALLTRFGNMIRAWQYLDKDKSGKVSYTEFAKACLDLGFRGKLKELFRHIDDDATGMVSFQEFAPDIYAAFEEWFTYLRDIVDDERVSSGFKSCFGSQGNITRAEFLAGCQRLGYTEHARLCDPNTLFDWLDTDSGGSLNFESEIAWLEKQEVVKRFENLAEDRGMVRISGRFKLPTGNSMMSQQLRWRERRLSQAMGWEEPTHGIGILPQNPKYFTTLTSRPGSAISAIIAGAGQAPMGHIGAPPIAHAGVASGPVAANPHALKDEENDASTRLTGHLDHNRIRPASAGLPAVSSGTGPLLAIKDENQNASMKAQQQAGSSSGVLANIAGAPARGVGAHTDNVEVALCGVGPTSPIVVGHARPHSSRAAEPWKRGYKLAMLTNPSANPIVSAGSSGAIYAAGVHLKNIQGAGEGGSLAQAAGAGGTSKRPGTAPKTLSLRAMREEQKRRDRETQAAEDWKNKVYDRVQAMSALELQAVVDKATALPQVTWTLDGERAVIFGGSRERAGTVLARQRNAAAREERRQSARLAKELEAKRREREKKQGALDALVAKKVVRIA
ncbi:unnamed protein product [Amoebophrya sp. A25]|nr:unnamed protein product [Amoebophrya sp. A25]|eukprot:GSA25T00021830001.1